jgi:tetratricopeptide (TPR) repeat protein
MKTPTVLLRFGAFSVFVLFFVGATIKLTAQPSAETTPGSAEQLSQSELLKSFLQVREQLHATELAMASADAKARAQTAGIAQQLETIKSSMVADHERQQVEAQRWQAERDRQQAEARRAEGERARLQIESDRASQRMLYIASSFGCVGLLAMVLTPLFQWRAINRIAEVDAMRAQPNALVSVGDMLPDDGGAGATSLANQRLMTAIDRIEQRILELENTAIHPLPEAITESPRGISRNGAAPHRLPAAGTDRTTRIALLLAKGRSLLSTNKPAEALAAYEEILAIDPDHTDALLRKGVALERLTRDAEALASYDRAIAIDAKMALAYLHKGGICQRLARHAEAVACYEQALQVEEAAK